MASLKLYVLPGCPYCVKVEEELDDQDLEYDTVEVPSDHDERDEVEAVSGQTNVPVLVDREHGVEGMAESDDIVEYLQTTYGDATAA